MLKTNFKYIGEGRHRSVYRHGNYVVKIPLCDEGIHDNLWEAQKFRKEKEYAAIHDTIKIEIQYARCRLIPKSCILVMQFACEVVNGLTDENGWVYPPFRPDWTGYIDCHQVGFNRFGQLVAYDYGIM